MTEKRLYLDMDGTLARFHQVDRMEELFEIGYFLKLEPNMYGSPKFIRGSPWGLPLKYSLFIL